MKDIYIICLIAFAMTGPLGAVLYEKMTEKDVAKNGEMTTEEGMMNSTVIAVISIFPFSIIILSRVTYLFFNP